MSKFEEQFPKPESLGDFDDVLLDCWKEKRKGWLAAWKLALAKYRQHGCMCFEEIAEQEIDANEEKLS